MLYKGFDKDLKCKGFQYEIGKEYEEEKAELCEHGFHACENPLDVFGYYPPSDSRYCEVELGDISPIRSSEDSKCCGKKIKIVSEIGIKGIVDAFIKFTFSKVNFEKPESATGDRSAATNTGDRSAATNTGDRSAATNTGDRSAATNTGDRSAATNTGNRSAAIVSGKESIAIATGCSSKAKGSIGCWLVIAERDEIGKILEVRAAKVDGKEIKADTFYTLVNGEFKEISE